MLINDQAVLDEVHAAVSAYEAALEANDLDALDAFFWASPNTVRLGVSENLYGFEAIAAFRKGRVGGSPPRARTRTEVLALGHDVAVAHVEFVRQDTGRAGRQSQTWIRTDAGWKVASAHVSLLQGAPDQRGAAPAHSALPVFSLAGFENADAESRARRALDLRRACEDSGFLYLVDHGIAPELIDAVLAQSRRFFDLPEAHKRRFDKALSPCNRGYEPLRGQTLEPGAPPDLKEGYYIGADLAQDDPRVVAGVFNHGPNLWPDGLPGWREVMERYFAAMTALCVRLMRALALSLDLPADYFDSFCDEPMATLRLLHYPPQPPQGPPGEKGCGAHTDFGALTLLLQDDVGGLQVLDADRGWIDAPPISGAFVVNLGDLIARWTNDRYRSTLHRVINASGRERYSVPFFFTGRADHVVACLPTCLEAGAAPHYAPTTAIGHLEEMYGRTYGAGARG